MAALREEDIGLADKNQRVDVAYGHIMHRFSIASQGSTMVENL